MEISNLRVGRVQRHALVIVASLGLALSLAGVAVRPRLGLRAAEQELGQAEARVRARDAEAASLSQFEAGGGVARMRAALARLARLLPTPIPELELHGLLRLLAQRSAVTLRTLELGEPYDSGLARLDDVAALREVHLTGEGSLTQILALLAAVRALDRPVAVLEFQLTRREARERSSFTLLLGFFESRPLADFPEEAEPRAGEGSAQESP